MLITFKHVKACGFCVKGIKDYCIVNSIDYYEFIHFGVDSTKLPNDQISRKIIEKAKQMEK